MSVVLSLVLVLHCIGIIVAAVVYIHVKHTKKVYFFFILSLESQDLDVCTL
jgi:hypothetical protein